MRNKDVDFEILKGKTIIKIENKGDELFFRTSDGKTYLMYHSQDCCELVYLEDTAGDLNDLLNSPILQAEVETNSDKPKDEYDDSFTWTFYKLATIKGSVTLRWYGTSNGYYSQTVDFVEVFNQ